MKVFFILCLTLFLGVQAADARFYTSRRRYQRRKDISLAERERSRERARELEEEKRRIQLQKYDSIRPKEEVDQEYRRKEPKKIIIEEEEPEVKEYFEITEEPTKDGNCVVLGDYLLLGKDILFCNMIPVQYQEKGGVLEKISAAPENEEASSEREKTFRCIFGNLVYNYQTKEFFFFFFKEPLESVLYSGVEDFTENQNRVKMSPKYIDEICKQALSVNTSENETVLELKMASPFFSAQLGEKTIVYIPRYIPEEFTVRSRDNAVDIFSRYRFLQYFSAVSYVEKITSRDYIRTKLKFL